MLTAVIVEDEPHAVRRLSMQLRHVPDLTIAGVARDGIEGVRLIERVNPDIAFVDINLPTMTGLEVADHVRKRSRTAIIFVTAHDMHAIEAFRLAAVDYLLKPVQKYRVVEAVERARARKSVGEERRDALFDVFRGAGRMPPPQEFEVEMWVTSRRKTVRLVLSTVEMFKAERDYIRVFSEGGEFLIRESMRALEERLDARRFLRLHRSTIVNIDRVVEIERSAGGRLSVRLASGRRMPVGDTYADVVRALAPREQTPLRRDVG